MTSTRRTTTALIALLTVALTSNLYANPDLGSILGDSAFDGIVDTGQSLIQIEDEAQDVTATLLLELAAFNGSNIFGIYDPRDPENKLMLFAGSDSPTTSVIVNFDIEASLAWIDASEKVSMPGTFGLYIDSSATADHGGGVFYSQSELNTDADTGVSHALIFNTTAVSSAIPGSPDLVVAWEDLRYDSTNYNYDGDYNDMVLGITNVTSVPEPATIVLLGLSSLALLRKRRNG